MQRARVHVTYLQCAHARRSYKVLWLQRNVTLCPDRRITHPPSPVWATRGLWKYRAPRGELVRPNEAATTPPSHLMTLMWGNCYSRSTRRPLHSTWLLCLPPHTISLWRRLGDRQTDRQRGAGRAASAPTLAPNCWSRREKTFGIMGPLAAPLIPRVPLRHSECHSLQITTAQLA